MKKLLSIAAVAALVLTGCSKDLKVKTVDKLTVEYGDKLDNSKLYDAKESDENVRIDKIQNYDAKKIGDQTLKVTFSNGDKTIEKEIKVTVKDTKKPEIILKKDKVTITAGDKLDLKDNVKAVKDPVDGDLKYSDKELKKSGYYIDKEKLDTKKVGTYEVIVKAFDVNGNAAETTFKVVVKKKPEKKAVTSKQSSVVNQGNTNAGQQAQSSTPSSSGQSNQRSETNGGQSSTVPSGGTPSNNGSQNKPQEPQKPQACTIPSNQQGYNNMIFATETEAEAFGTQMQEDPANNIRRFHYGAISDTCDNIVGYGVWFQYR